MGELEIDDSLSIQATEDAIDELWEMLQGSDQDCTSRRFRRKFSDPSSRGTTPTNPSAPSPSASACSVACLKAVCEASLRPRMLLLDSRETS